MTTEQELKDQCTPEFIKWMCELAEGFKIYPNRILGQIESVSGALFTLEYNNILNDSSVFPLLIHRAVEGWNKKYEESINIYKDCVTHDFYPVSHYLRYDFENYQPQSLTQAECAMLHCMLNIFKEERK